MSRFASRDGVGIYYECRGEGMPVLFLHAGVADSRMWNQQFDVVDDFQLIRLDLRGHGSSDLGCGQFSNHADVLDLLDHLRVEQAVLVGCSVGADIALHVCEAASERVSGLVLVAADAPGFDPEIDYESPEWPAVVEAFRAGDFDRMASLEAEMWLAGMGRSTSELDGEIVSLFIEMDRIALENEDERDRLNVAEPLESLPEIAAQTLIVIGERDIPQVRASGAHLAEKLSDGPPVVISDAAHLPSMDQPEAFTEALTGILDRL